MPAAMGDRRRSAMPYVDDDDDEVLADGASWRFPVLLMDSDGAETVAPALHRPGYIAALSDAQIAARQEMIDRAVAAWRAPGAARRDADDGFRFPLTLDAARALACDARDEMIRRATTAWRAPVSGNVPVGTNLSERRFRDAAQPDNSSPPEVMRRHLYGAPGLGDPSTAHAEGFGAEAAAQGARDRAWRQYRDNLSNAWRGGRTDPRRAPRIEEELE